MIATDDRPALDFYREVARRLEAGQLTPDEVTRQVRSTLPARAAVEWLQAEAEARLYRAPRAGWALAHVAHAVAQSLADSLLEAECTLTLTVALNTRGEFQPAIALAHQAADVFMAHGRRADAVQCLRAAALAHTELRQPEQALACLGQARGVLDEGGSPAEAARCDRLEAQIRRYQGERAAALALLERAHKAFGAAELPLEVAHCELEVARAVYFQNPARALELVDRAGHAFREAGHVARTALCDHYRALAFQELNRYPEALAILDQTRAQFAQHGMDHFVALADAALGIIYWRQNDYTAALAAHQRARDFFARRDIPVWVAMCDLNLAAVHESLNHYADALALYSRAMEVYRRESLPVEAARCQENMALVYGKLGLYDRALALHQQAHHLFAEQGLGTYVATCHENMADTYCALHQYDAALERYHQAREGYVQHRLPVYVARCDTYLSDVYVATGRLEEALACLERARGAFEALDMPVHVAACERRLARVHAGQAEPRAALALLGRARQVFTRHGLAVDAALCDLEHGQVYLAEGRAEVAEEHFNAALAVLAPGFPDQAWRAHEGRGRCARLRRQPRVALAHHLTAVQMVSQTRARLPTERLSSGLFTGRQAVYEDALRLALELGAAAEALTIIEASRAQTLLALASQPAVGWQKVARQDAFIRQLVEQEQTLRQQLVAMRRELTLQEPGETGPLLRGGDEPRFDQSEGLADLTRLMESYEETLERLRVAAPRAAEAHRPSAFSLSTLRETMARHFSGRWAAVTYYIISTGSMHRLSTPPDDTLVSVYLDEQRLAVRTYQLDRYDRLALRQCTAAEPDFRELVYRGTLRGHPASERAGPTHLRHLYRILIPPEVEAMGEDGLLILAPHDRLHGLPFAALLSDAGPLVRRVPLLYTPSLKVLELLMQGSQDTEVQRSRGAEESTSAPPHLRSPAQLVCGVSDFGGRARPLPWARAEVGAVRRVFGDSAHVLEGEAASVETLRELNVSGALQRFDVLHFATHAILDRVAPTQSRLLLADDDLTAADILSLGLQARLVTLSACDSALGHLQPGDEIMGLVQAFFLAGARSVVAGLWQVEDAVAVELMERFYGELQAGRRVADALREAQLAMYQAGATPYQWAPFIAIGCP